MKIVVFLQNAWSPLYAGGTWPRQSWLRALERSRSGQRLRLLIDDLNLVENTTPIVGATPNSVVPPDYVHILDTIVAHQPEVVVACGTQAQKALLEVWRSHFLGLPHPACRIFQNKLLKRARSLLENNYSGRAKLVPLKPPKVCKLVRL